MRPTTHLPGWVLAHERIRRGITAREVASALRVSRGRVTALELAAAVRLVACERYLRGLGEIALRSSGLGAP